MNALTNSALALSTSISPVPPTEAELIDVCDGHAAAIRAYNTSSPAEAMGESPTWAAYARSRDAIAAGIPWTMAGILAKCRAVKAEALGPDGEETLSGTPAEYWALDIVNDLLRLFGEPSPDAPLIAACEEFLRIDREFSAFCSARDDEELERDEEASIAMMAPQKALAEQIVALQATTAEAHLARLRIIAFGLLPKNSQCKDVPGAAMIDRFQAATLRDLVRAERGDVA